MTEVSRPPEKLQASEKSPKKKPERIPLVTASADRTARIWDASTGECERTIWAHTKEVSALSCTSDGGHFVTGGWDRTVKVWSVEDTGQDSTLTIQPNSGHRAVAMMLKPSFSPAGNHIAIVAQDSTIRVWNGRSGECQKTLRGHTCDVKCACFSPDEKYLITGSVDRQARIWDWVAGKSVHVLKGHLGAVLAAAYSSSGLLAITASDDCTAMAWDVTTGKAVLKLRGHTNSINSVCFSLDGSLIGTGSADGTARLWDASSGECTQTLGRLGQQSCVNSVSLSPDGSLLAMGSSDRTVKIWSTKTGTEEHILRKHEAAVTSVSFLKPRLQLPPIESEWSP